jgi:hypothetical protein
MAELLEHVREGFARYDAGEINAFGLDELIHRYQIAERELWKFCSVSGGRVETAVRMLELWQERGEMPDCPETADKTSAHALPTEVRVCPRTREGQIPVRVM